MLSSKNLPALKNCDSSTGLNLESNTKMCQSLLSPFSPPKFLFFPHSNTSCLIIYVKLEGFLLRLQKMDFILVICKKYLLMLNVTYNCSLTQGKGRFYQLSNQSNYLPCNEMGSCGINKFCKGTVYHCKLFYSITVCQL